MAQWSASSSAPASRSPDVACPPTLRTRQPHPPGPLGAGGVGPGLPHQSGRGCLSPQSRETASSLPRVTMKANSAGAPGGIRTHDLRFRKPLDGRRKCSIRISLWRCGVRVASCVASADRGAPGGAGIARLRPWRHGRLPAQDRGPHARSRSDGPHRPGRRDRPRLGHLAGILPPLLPPHVRGPADQRSPCLPSTHLPRSASGGARGTTKLSGTETARGRGCVPRPGSGPPVRSGIRWTVGIQS